MHLLYIFCFFLILSACKNSSKKDEGSSATPIPSGSNLGAMFASPGTMVTSSPGIIQQQTGSLVPPEKLNATGVTSIATQKLATAINAFSDVYAVDPDDARDACNSEYRRVTATAAGQSMNIQSNLDLTQCKNTNLRAANSQFTVRNCKIQYKGSFTCDRGSLDQINGRSIYDLATQVVCDSGNVKLMSSSIFNCEYVVQSNGQEYVKRVSSYFEFATQGHTPCSEQGLGAGRFRIGDCVQQTRSESDVFRTASGGVLAGDVGEIGYSLSNLANLETDTPRRPAFYARGTLNVMLSDWQVVFNFVNSLQAPAWVATRGSERQQGTFTYNPTLGLVDTVAPVRDEWFDYRVDIFR